jgi:hypothetical protein
VSSKLLFSMPAMSGDEGGVLFAVCLPKPLLFLPFICIEDPYCHLGPIGLLMFVQPAMVPVVGDI